MLSCHKIEDVYFDNYADTKDDYHDYDEHDVIIVMTC